MSKQYSIIPVDSMISTLIDSAIFIRALTSATLLNADEKCVYASVYWFNYSDSLLGYQSVASYQRDIKAVVFQFINSTGGNSAYIASLSDQKFLQIPGK
tara:strand:+ start:278 stop:574 length:297 start_codon:yes stop_codon:yes gene_type:complete